MADIRSAKSADQRDSARCRYTAHFGRAHLFVYARNLGTVLRVDGEIDASNAEDLTRAVRNFARLKTPMVLDLSHLRFISVEGFRAATPGHTQRCVVISPNPLRGLDFRLLAQFVLEGPQRLDQRGEHSMRGGQVRIR